MNFLTVPSQKAETYPPYPFDYSTTPYGAPTTTPYPFVFLVPYLDRDVILFGTPPFTRSAF